MDELTPEHEAACLRALRAAWEEQNLSRFRGKLRPPALELSAATSRLGQWDATTRTIQLARDALRVGGAADADAQAGMAFEVGEVVQ